MEYYSALRRKDILMPATTWIDLKDMVLSNISQTQDRPCLIPLLEGPKGNPIHRGRKWLAGECFIRIELPFEKQGSPGDGWRGVATHVNVLHATELCS